MAVELPDPELRAGINTALLNLAEQSQFCRPDGRDLRVSRQDGRPVPHRARVRDNETLDLLFHASGDCSRFFVYYGNPDAEKAEGEWRESLGGLLLETYPVGEPIERPADTLLALEPYLPGFRGRPWPQVWDLRNPFGRDDLYVSVYKGTIYCPETGAYVFAVNADDLALFALDEMDDPLCWRGPGVPSMSWHDPDNPRSVCEKLVERGVYRFSYYHAENRGTQLAQLGWRRPSSDIIVTVPPQAFVRYLPAEIASRQVRGRKVSPFFVARHRYNLRVNGIEPGFPSFRFEARLPAGAEAEATAFEWDFGDGASARGPVAEHEFGSAETHQVSLTVRSPDGSQTAVKRPVLASAAPVKDASLRLTVASNDWLIAPDAPVRLQVLIQGEGAGERGFEVVTTAAGASPAGGQLPTSSQTVSFPPARAQDGMARAELEEAILSGRENVRISVKALLHGVEVAGQEIVVLRTDGHLAGLRMDQAQALRDERGSLAVLRVARLARGKAPPRRIHEPNTGTVSVLVFDEMLGGPPGAAALDDYADLLRSLLAAQYPDLTFTIRRAPSPAEPDVLPMHRLLHVYRTMSRLRPNLVMLVCQPQSVIDGVPLAEFEKSLGASLDQILARSRSEVVVVTPTPLPGSPEASRPYARAAKQVGLRRGLPVVDLYSRFLLSEGWEELFRARGGRHPAFLLYPDERGQERVAREIYATLISSFHSDLSAAARRVSLARAARAASEP
jgi:hypothetical protein